MENKRKIGGKYERIAAAFLYKELGYRILEMNYRVRSGEVDIVANDHGTICFIEVKYRNDLSHGYPEEAVSLSKQKKIINVSLFYIRLHNLPIDTAVRFDVVSILGDKIKVIKNAFGGV